MKVTVRDPAAGALVEFRKPNDFASKSTTVGVAIAVRLVTETEMVPRPVTGAERILPL